MPRRNVEINRLVEAMKRAGAALRDADVDFLLGGGLACWARGGPATDHDVDLMIRREDAEQAAEAAAKTGMRVERPPEEWLIKAFNDDDTLVDLIFEPSSGPVDDGWFERAEEMEVSGMRMLVASLEDVMVAKLMVLNEQEPDYGPVLEIARTLREQIEWEQVRERTASSPFAKAFFTLGEELGIVPRVQAEV
jgi:predicted nucleotidyltransferase